MKITRRGKLKKKAEIDARGGPCDPGSLEVEEFPIHGRAVEEEGDGLPILPKISTEN